MNGSEWNEHSVEARLGRIETEIAIIRALQSAGVKIPQTMLVLLWGVLLALMGSLVFVVRLDAHVDEIAGVVGHNTALIQHHIELPWHVGDSAGEKYNALDQRLEQFDQRLRAVEKHP